MAKKSLKTLRQAQGFYPERGRRIKKGIFITFEGPEGCGKSTQAKLLYDYLKDLGYKCVLTREPGGTKAGEEIRQMLLHAKDIEISDLTELFLFEASRAQIAGEVITPELKDRKIVICDRFSDATLCYQGYGGKLPLETIGALNKISSRGLKPDITILLDLNVVTGLKRARIKGLDRMEKKDLDYHKRVRAGYLKLAANDPGRIKVISVRDTIGRTQGLVRQEVARVVR